VKTAKIISAAIALALAAGAAAAGEAGFNAKPAATRAGGKTQIAFTVSAGTDVEVAILDAKGKVIRHLAAGVLGGKAPPPAPLKPGLSQKLEWDGKDDYGDPPPSTVHPPPFSVRVRVGMGAKLDRIVGGDPYAFFSLDTNHGNHAVWYMGGLELKKDGSVYVAGSQNQFGTHTIRRYDADGNYLNTVFPPPAGKPVEKMKAWGLNFNEDGSYTPRYGRLQSPFMSVTPFCTERLELIRLMPSAANDKLVVLGRNYRTVTINTDGTIAEPQIGPIVAKPGWPGQKDKVRPYGPLYTCLAPDGKTFYLSGMLAGKNKGTRGGLQAAAEDHFWQDGQVWKVDTATREAKKFFSINKVIASPAQRRGPPIGGTDSYSELHGVAVDDEGNVFVCDRLNKRIVVLDKDAKIIRELPVPYPDAIVLGPKRGVLYVTTRFGQQGTRGEVKLIKFADWRKGGQPAIDLRLCEVNQCYDKLNGSHLLVAPGKDGPNIWVTYKDLPVRIYRDRGNSFELVKDFYKAGPQRCLSLYHMMADPKTENIFVSDGFFGLFRLNDWKQPKLEPCYAGEGSRLCASSFCIDPRNRHLYVRLRRKNLNVKVPRRGQDQGIGRFNLDGEYLAPAPLGKSGDPTLTEAVIWNWVITYGNMDYGMAAAPNGNLAALGAPAGTKNDYSAHLLFFNGNEKSVPWKATRFDSFGIAKLAGGVRFDLQGNLYVGRREGKPGSIPKGFAGDKNYAVNLLKIYKYAPSGSLKEGNLFPKGPKGPTKVYDVPYTMGSGRMFRRSALFGVDGYGRIYYPTTLAQKVSVMDNAGNQVLRFGTYGNRDSMGGLEGDLVPTKDIPMAYPSSVDATDNYIYVADLVNVRLLRLVKTFAAEEQVSIR
jgi:hypothetical protein